MGGTPKFHPCFFFGMFHYKPMILGIPSGKRLHNYMENHRF